MKQALELPVLLLDIDGVLLTLNEERPSDGAKNYRRDRYTYYYPNHGEWLRPILEKTDGWYMTAHCERAYMVGELLSLPSMSWVPYHRYYSKDAPDRAGAADALFSGRPLVWIDDSHTSQGIYAWAERRNAAGVPTLLVEPDGDRGLEYGHTQTIERWLGELAAK